MSDLFLSLVHVLCWNLDCCGLPLTVLPLSYNNSFAQSTKQQGEIIENDNAIVQVGIVHCIVNFRTANQPKTKIQDATQEFAMNEMPSPTTKKALTLVSNFKIRLKKI